MELELGDRVRDVVTKLEGIAIAKGTYLTGCDQFCVQPGIIKDGIPTQGSWFDVNRLELVEKGAVKVVQRAGQLPGGPQHGY